MPLRPLLCALLASVCLHGCAYHNTAEGWNGRVGFDGQPVFYTHTTKVGMNLFVVIPVFGETDVDGLVSEVTDHIAQRGGDHVRLVEGDSENYWYGFPPITWIFTPVTSTVAAEFRPSQWDFDAYRGQWDTRESAAAESQPAQLIWR